MDNFENFVAQTLEFAKEVGGDMKILSSKGIPVPVTDRFTYESGSQLFFLDFDGKIKEVFINGVLLDESQYDEKYKAVEILDPLEQTDRIRVNYEVKSNLNDIYGFEWNPDISAPEVTKIGNMALHTSLPVQSQMKRCLVTDDGNVNYFLGENDSTKKADGTAANLDGSDGQVLTRTPRHWRRFEAQPGKHAYLYSATPMPGATEFPEMFVSSYKASLDRGNNKLSSVVNTSANYRGGANQGAWDAENEYKSQLGKPVTHFSRIEFRNAAKNRGADWYDMDYVVRDCVALLMTCEYGTRHHQAAISEGPTNISSANWNDFNSRYPLFRCGLTNSLGNNTGEVAITLQDFPTAGQTFETQVFSYRGIENFYGDIWEWTNGVNVLDGVFHITKAKNISDTGVEGYKPIGQRANSGYISKMWNGTILSKETAGASSTTHWTDYTFAANTGIRGLLFGGNATNGAPAGSFCSYSSLAPSHASTNVGGRLCFLKR